MRTRTKITTDFIYHFKELTRNVFIFFFIAVFILITRFTGFAQPPLNIWSTIDDCEKDILIYYNAMDGERGPLNSPDFKYSWTDSSYRAVVKSTVLGTTWGGMWHILIGHSLDNRMLDFQNIFGPIIKKQYQGRIDSVQIVINNAWSSGTIMKLDLEFADTNSTTTKTISINLNGLAYPYIWTVYLDTTYGSYEQIKWVIKDAVVGDSIEIGRFRLHTRVPDLGIQKNAFLWSYSWLMYNHFGMTKDQCRHEKGTFESISATAKAAKNTFYAYNLGLVTLNSAETIITSIADRFINTVPREPKTCNEIWPHFTKNQGIAMTVDSILGILDACQAALDLIATLQMIGDPNNQLASLESYVTTSINWVPLVAGDTILHGYRKPHCDSLLPYPWDAFGMESINVIWAYASATGKLAWMNPPPTFNGSGFIENGNFPMVCSGVDRWGNDWDNYREQAADQQITWYKTSNTFLYNAGLFGLSAAETPEGGYANYGTGGVGVDSLDGGSEIVVLHYCAMISDIRFQEAVAMWEVLQVRNTLLFPAIRDKIVISPLNNMESMRVDKISGEITGMSRLKGGWNLSLQAEGWALSDTANSNALLQAVQNNPLLYQGYISLGKPSSISEKVLGTVKVNLFPNPSEGIVNVVLNNIASPIEIQIFTIEGTLIYQDYIKSNTLSHNMNFDISTFANGLYILNIKGRSSVLNKKMLIFH